MERETGFEPNSNSLEGCVLSQENSRLLVFRFIGAASSDFLAFYASYSQFFFFPNVVYF
jgi:hypothetical protein